MSRNAAAEIVEGVSAVYLPSWEQFIEHIKAKHSWSPALIYRGQGRAEWPVVSKLDRTEANFSKMPNRHGEVPHVCNCPPVDRLTHLRAFKEAARGRRGQNPPDLSEAQWWALGQHHGLSTPLLDWTRSPFVALFFAFEDELVRDDKNCLSEPDERAVFSLSSNAICDGDGTDQQKPPRPFSPLGETTHRLVNQSGIFLCMPEKCDLESYVSAHFKRECSETMGAAARCILEKMIISNKDRRGCLRYLNKMNINRMSLFPDLDGAASYVDALWELEFDTSLGYIPGDLPEDL